MIQKGRDSLCVKPPPRGHESVGANIVYNLFDLTKVSVINFVKSVLLLGFIWHCTDLIKFGLLSKETDNCKLDLPNSYC